MPNSEASTHGVGRDHAQRVRSRWLLVAGASAVVALAVVIGPQIRSRLGLTVGAPDTTFELVAFPADALPALRIGVAGDVGDGNDLEWRTAETMAAASVNDPYDVLALLGDNVYPEGDPGLLDTNVFLPFEAVLDSGARLVAVSGNHDALQSDGGSAEMAGLGMSGLWWAERVGDVLLVGLDSNEPDNVVQEAWLDQTLANSDAPWKIVLLHHPPYSAGYHGSSGDVRDAFEPLFDRYGVQLVLSGHDHDYQRSVPINGVTYVVSGAAAGTRPTGAAEFTAYSASTPHFLEVNVFPDRLVLRAIDHQLRVFDEATIQLSSQG